MKDDWMCEEKYEKRRHERILWVYLQKKNYVKI